MSTAQIETPDLGVVAQHSARPFRADPPHGQNIRPLTQRERLARVLLHEQDAEPESVPARARRRSARTGKRSTTARARLFDAPGAVQAPIVRFSQTLSDGNTF